MILHNSVVESGKLDGSPLYIQDQVFRIEM